MQKNKERFERWFVKPLRELEAIPNGDGAFIALAVSCFLYERYVRAKAVTETPEKRFDDKLDIKYRDLQLARDFNTNEATAAAFWKVMRNGLLHSGMPQFKGTKEKPQWRFDYSYLQPFALSQNAGEWWLEVQPWRFMDAVIKICQNNIDLIIGSTGFPWATIEEEDKE